MQTPSPITAVIELQADGLTVRLSFELSHPEFSTQLSGDPLAGGRLSEEFAPAEATAIQCAQAAGPGLLQAFEQAQSVVQASLGRHAEKQRQSLLSQHPIGGAA